MNKFCIKFENVLIQYAKLPPPWSIVFIGKYHKECVFIAMPKKTNTSSTSVKMPFFWIPWLSALPPKDNEMIILSILTLEMRHNIKWFHSRTCQTFCSCGISWKQSGRVFALYNGSVVASRSTTESFILHGPVRCPSIDPEGTGD